ncbi:type VI secretion system Vgr family protein [Schauerella aestuarii]|uniref:type VI secretion system Vgr family protein n=1 Tax=Schauerella aestuarii TaxID=2511204 RepID=UPI00136B9E15|nr:type VI secretion system tip protein TssI/VgrG [Achromobacter aestuarii]
MPSIADSTHILNTDRSIRVSVGTEPSGFLFDAMQGTDGLSTLSEYRVRLLHRSMQVDVGSLLGQPLVLTIEATTAPRYLGGVIASFALLGQADDTDRYFAYEAVAVPWLWLATHKREFRIYQNQSVPDTIKQVLAPYGYAFEFELAEKYEPRVYCVQYDESDFQFVSRLLEAEGIHYYFRHAQDKHTLVMSDEVQNHKTVAGYEQVRYFLEDKLTRPQQEHMTRMAVYQSLRPGRYTTNDYNFVTPNADLKARQHIQLPHEHNQAEVYDWPGNYGDTPLGERYARQRMEEQHHVRNTRTLHSTARGVATGSLFNLTGCPRTEENREYLVLATRYDLKENNYSSLGDDASQGHRCRFNLTVQDSKLPFRPPRTTEKPRSKGPQTAVVVGPQGKEIWTDEYGQVKVHFHWDRYDKRDENSSCWIRVSSSWASGNFGAIQVPRIGDEVIVDFLNGDPDCPIITGRVYNAAKMPPWTLPENETQMGIYTRSSPGGNYHTANALRFEDKTGQEEIYILAQKDRNEKTKHNHTERIDNNWVQAIGNHKAIEVDGNHSESVHGNMVLHVGPSGVGRVLSDSFRKLVEGIGNVAKALPIPGINQLGRGVYSLFADQAINEATAGVKTEFVGISKTVTVGGTIVESAGHSIQLTSGSHISLDAANTVSMTSNGEFHVQVGKSELRLTADGFIRLSGDTLFLNFENGIEMQATNEIALASKKINLN